MLGLSGVRPLSMNHPPEVTCVPGPVEPPVEPPVAPPGVCVWPLGVEAEFPTLGCSRRGEEPGLSGFPRR